MSIGTYDVQNITYNIHDEPATVTIDYIENTEALGALLALMYLDQDGNIVCSQSILYAAIRMISPSQWVTQPSIILSTWD